MALLDDKLWRVIAGDNTYGWRDITGEVSGLTYSHQRNGGPVSAAFAIHQSTQGQGYNELREGKGLRIFYAGRPVWRGLILPRPLSYQAGHNSSDVVRIEAAGPYEVTKRRNDYARVFVDLDVGEWFAADRDEMLAAIAVDTSYNSLKFVCPKGTTITGAATPFAEYWYWINRGMVADQHIVKLSFRVATVGAMHWQVYETTDQVTASATWSALGAAGGGATTASTAVTRTCSAGVHGLALRVYYNEDNTLTGDEYVKFTQLAVTGESGTITPASALTSVLVTSGLADSFSSDTVS